VYFGVVFFLKGPAAMNTRINPHCISVPSISLSRCYAPNQSLVGDNLSLVFAQNPCASISRETTGRYVANNLHVFLEAEELVGGGVFEIAPPVNNNEEDKEVGVEEEGLEPCPRVEYPLPPTILGRLPGK
jgi:hypothetical protein